MSKTYARIRPVLFLNGKCRLKPTICYYFSEYDLVKIRIQILFNIEIFKIEMLFLSNLMIIKILNVFYLHLLFYTSCILIIKVKM